MVHYVKDAFLNGRTFTDLADLNAQARSWLTQTANTRIHATTGRRPLDLWPQEKLTPVASVARYQLADLVPRQAGLDGFLRFEKSRYSLPPEYAGQTVFVGHQEHKIVIRSQDMIVAEHLPAPKAGATVADPLHLEALWKLSLRNTKTPPPRWQLTFDAQVQTTPLVAYREAGS